MLELELLRKDGARVDFSIARDGASCCSSGTLDFARGQAP